MQDQNRIYTESATSKVIPTLDAPSDEIEGTEKNVSPEETSTSCDKNENQGKYYHPHRKRLGQSIIFPNQMRKNNQEEQFCEFVELFKKIEINIPLDEVIGKIPTSKKFLKDAITKNCNPYSKEFFVMSIDTSKLCKTEFLMHPFLYGNYSYNGALCNSSMSINLIPFTIFKKLGLPTEQPSKINIQMTDWSFAHIIGMVKDVLVKGRTPRKVQ